MYTDKISKIRNYNMFPPAASSLWVSHLKKCIRYNTMLEYSDF